MSRELPEVIARNGFKVGDKVMLRGAPFWLSITGFQTHGYVSCRFGSIGGDAGPGIHETQLRHMQEKQQRNASFEPLISSSSAR